MDTKTEKKDGSWTLDGVTRVPERKAKPEDRYRKMRLGFIGVLLIFVFSLSFLRLGTGNNGAEICQKRGLIIADALIQYHKQHGSLPPAYTTDRNGKPLHSWRTLLLPFLNKSDVFDQIRMDEPWDSDYNKLFHDKMPEEFQCPATREKSRFYTHWQVLQGAKTFFPSHYTKKLTDCKRLSNEVILIMEGTPAVHWMSPSDIPVENIAKKIGASHGNAFIGVTLDMQARIFSLAELPASQIEQMASIE